MALTHLRAGLAVYLLLIGACSTTDSTSGLAPAPDGRDADPAHLYELGVLYATGSGGLRNDDSVAERLFVLAADQGYTPARQYLGAFYQNGRGGLAKDDTEAVRLFRLAADHGDAAGEYHLADCYENGRCGLAKDDRQAARLYRLSADQANAGAEANLAEFYESGRGGLPQDGDAARRLWRLAADHGSGWAQARLGYYYANGSAGFARDDREAAQLLQSAAAQGEQRGEAYLGYFYEMGRGGLPLDSNQAARWYRLAAAQGDAFAKEGLARLRMAASGDAPPAEVRDPDKTIATVSEALAEANLPPDIQADLLHERADAYRRKGVFDSATKDLADARRIAPDFASADLKACRREISEKQWEDAIAACGRAVDSDRDDARGFSNRGMAYLHLHEVDKAERDFDEAVRLDPALAAPRVGRANVHFHRGEYDQVVSEVDQAIKLEPAPPATYDYLRGLALYRQGKDSDAVKSFSDGAKHFSIVDPTLLLARARANRWRGDYDAVLRDSTEVVDRMTKAPRREVFINGLANSFASDAHEIRGDAYFDKTEYDKAIADYNDALGLTPKNPSVRGGRGNSDSRISGFSA
jgi:TPR repeat protein